MAARPKSLWSCRIARCLVIGVVIMAALVLNWLVSGREIVPDVTEGPAGPCVVDWHTH